jgi:endonuclease/exonuclease/phosphatase family metal-dependent hydrolase
MRVLTWNLFHGRAQPAAGRPLLVEFAQALAGWSWDVALLQEVPPWWPPLLGHAAGAEQRLVLTSRNSLARVRRAVGRRNPDLIASNGGGSNAILVRGRILEHRGLELARRPERRVAHGVHLPGGTWVVNLHATKDPKPRTREDCARALQAAFAWADGAPLVFGGDLNLTQPTLGGVIHVAACHVDHLFVRGLRAAGPAEPLDAGTLSDHSPLVVDLDG